LGNTTSGGFTAAQLYSTASYQAHDLIEIGLEVNNLTGWNFAGQNLTNANFWGATLTGADLSQASLTGASFYEATLTDANLSQANLTNAFVAGATLTGADFSRANLNNVDFLWAMLSGADFTGADTRGSRDLDLALTIHDNTIEPNGRIQGLQLTGMHSLTVRDYHGDSRPNPIGPPGPIPILVEQHLTMGATGALRLRFEDTPWDSLISFAPRIPVTLGGTLDLDFVPGVNVAAQIGRTIRIFNWTGVTPIGTFAVQSPYLWDLSRLYTTGEVTLFGVPLPPGDFNRDGIVDAADYVVWRNGLGATYTQADYDAWWTHFGQTAGSGAAGYPLGASAEPLSATIPEPSTAVSFIIATITMTLGCRAAYGRRVAERL
jgi:hypothetical protein